MKLLTPYKAIPVILLSAFMLLSACGDRQEASVKEVADREPTERAEDTTGDEDLEVALDSGDEGALVWGGQGWEQDEAMDFYNTSQGSQLMPYSWFLALEQADSDRLFRDSENIRRFGYIPQGKTPGINPDGLPIGFVKDDNPEDFLSHTVAASGHSADSPDLYSQYREWLGLTCAACHTSEMIYGNQTLRIDGGPPLSDFQSLIEGMSAAVTATVNDDDKLTRFAQDVLADGGYNETEKQRLKTEAAAFLGWLNNYIEINYGGLTSPYGYGRLDAFGAILNRVTSSFTGIAQNATPANAPVSYPFLWNTSHLSWVQWNGSVNNHIGRNFGEVSGVFAHTIVKTDNAAERFDSSAKIMNLFRLEEYIGRLQSPKWGWPLPQIVQPQADKGKALYAKNCVVCHGIRDADGKFPMTPVNPVGKQFIDINMIALKTIGTDPLMAMNFVDPALNVDPGVVRPYLPEPYRTADKVPRGVMLNVVVGAVTQKQIAAFNPPLTPDQLLALTGYHLPEDKGGAAPPNLVAYKARPLNGIWATAPYLHNGSVPNLDQLLRPENERVQSFTVGGKEFDAVNVGFKPNSRGNQFTFQTVDGQGNPIPGNSNAGHSGKRHTTTKGEDGEWSNYTDDQRAQLIEYLKSL
ncbi:MAG: di-heme-cytochrome C peroxidase [Gammaproteobacteria bacterium]|nr:di-heme-cytochrome C peroxidase [Gammaproteobacteria bacterium]